MVDVIYTTYVGKNGSKTNLYLDRPNGVRVTFPVEKYAMDEIARLVFDVFAFHRIVHGYEQPIAFKISPDKTFEVSVNGTEYFRSLTNDENIELSVRVEGEFGEISKRK